jgi:hypothetical protein
VTADVRQQLTEALDEAEKIAKAAIQGPWRTGAIADHLIDDIIYGTSPYGGDRIVQVANLEMAWEKRENAAHICRWDPATVLRLVERDRSLLNEWWSTKNAAGRLSDYGEGRLEILTEQANAAAAFWVGTPEVDG